MTPSRISDCASRKIAGFGFVCACMVVCIHICMDLGAMSSIGVFLQLFWRRITGVAVPFFFVFSGFLLAGHFGAADWWWPETKKRLKSLFVPYAIFNLVDLLISLSIGSVVLLFKKSFGGQSWADFGGIYSLLRCFGFFPLQDCQLTYLWFVRDLMVFVLISPLFALLFRRRALGLISIGSLMIFAVILPSMLPVGWDFKPRYLAITWVDGFFFFGVGVFLRWNSEIMRVKVCHGVTFIVSGLILSSLVALKVFEIPPVITASLLMAGSWILIRDVSIPKFMITSAFPLYLLHHFVIVLRPLLEHDHLFRHYWYTSNILYIIQVLIVIGLCVVTTFFMRRYLPKISAILFGGR